MKIKELDTTNWVKLAVSKDSTRFNLNETYRDKTCIVATDGHRLHLSNGLPEVAPHFLSGLDAQFPDYSHVMPKGKEVCAIELSIDTHSRIIILETIKRLEKLEALIKLQKPSEILRIVKLSVYQTDDKEPCHMRIRYDDDVVSFSCVIPCLSIVGEHPDIGVNLGYLIDAMKLNHIAPVTLKLYGPMNALTLTTEHQTALIMPARL